MSIKQNLDKWIAELESDGMCDISDNQVISLIRGYSALEAKCSALATENESINFYLRNGPVIRKGGGLAAAHQFAPETPVTDAFLAEVRVSAVDVAISELNQLAERSEKEAPIAAGHHRSAALYLQLFAAQLRQEAAQ